jgi:5-methylcytosine-specific restriction endonuclease McrA
VAKQLVYVELRDGKVFKILRTNAEAWRLPAGSIGQMAKSEAVKAIRVQVVARSNNECEHCGKRITWGNGEMNEVIPRGRGGHVSMDNCEYLCHACHQSRPDSVHGDRRFGGRAK